MEPDDRELVRQFRDGDRHAFEALVSRYKRRLYSTIYRMTRNHQATDELLQETFLKLYVSIDKYNDSFPFFPWLNRIAINNAINFFKKEQKRYGDRSLEEEVEERNLQPADGRNFFDPETAFVNKERDGKILEALQQLSPPYRMVLALRVFEDLSYKEIADMLELEIGTVMSRLNRARGQVREALGKYFKDGVKA